MALFHIIYVSSLVSSDRETVAAILDVSARNNKRKNITGMLLQSEGNILQVLEGEKEVVLETYSKVQDDPRHYDIFVLADEEVTERHFALWSMGFKQLEPEELASLPQAAHVFKARQANIASRVRPGDALAVLVSFAEGSMGI